MKQVLGAASLFSESMAWLILAGGLALLALELAKVGIPSLRALLSGRQDPALGRRPRHGLLWLFILASQLPFVAGVLWHWGRVTSFQVGSDGSWALSNAYRVTLDRFEPGELRSVEVLPRLAVYDPQWVEPVAIARESLEADFWIRGTDGREVTFTTIDPAGERWNGPRTAVQLGYGPDSACRYEKGPHGGWVFAAHAYGPAGPICAALRQELARPPASPATSLRPGDPVLARWEADGWWYPATVLEPGAGGQTTVRFTDGTSRELGGDGVRAFAELPRDALAVEADWEGKGRYYACKLGDRQEDRVTIRYEDGSSEQAPLSRLRFRLR